MNEYEGQLTVFPKFLAMLTKVEQGKKTDPPGKLGETIHLCYKIPLWHLCSEMFDGQSKTRIFFLSLSNLI